MNVQNPAASRGIAIQAVDLVKNYGTGSNMVHALRGVNVSFERGKFTAIMGPSGSGKSTLMHTLAGLDSATSGHILFGTMLMGCIANHRAAWGAFRLIA